jgi:hypothetical protein
LVRFLVFEHLEINLAMVHSRLPKRRLRETRVIYSSAAANEDR